jgi:hypothetical protein
MQDGPTITIDLHRLNTKGTVHIGQTLCPMRTVPDGLLSEVLPSPQSEPPEALCGGHLSHYHLGFPYDNLGLHRREETKLRVEQWQVKLSQED